MKDTKFMNKLTADFNDTLQKHNLIGVMIVGKENYPDISATFGGTAKQVGSLIAVITTQALRYFEQYGEEKEFVQAVTALKKADAATTSKFDEEINHVED